MLAVLLSSRSTAPTPIVARARVARACNPIAATVESQRVERKSFEEWAAGTGILAPKLYIDDLEELRGAKVFRDIAADEELCVVPRRCCLDLSGLVQGESPCEDLAPSKLWNSLAWYERLAVWLLAEKEQGAASVVSGYISYLPQPGCASFYDAPLHWDDEELRELQYPPIISAVYEQREQIRQLHQRLRAGGGSAAARVSLADLTWAEQVVWSRAFASTVQRADAPPPPPPPQMEKKVLFEAEWLGKIKEMIPGGETLTLGNEAAAMPPMEMALMPMLDSLNHASSASVSCSFDPAEDAFVLSTSRPLKAGEQALLSYGAKGNDELLQLFGFVEEPNPHDKFLCIGLDEQLRAESARLFANPQEMERRFGLVRKLGLEQALVSGELSERAVPAPTMHALRVLLGSGAELDGDLAKLRKPASLATEERVFGALRGYCKMARAAMGSTRKADVAQLGRKDLPRRERLALQFRAEKKRLLSKLENSLDAVAARSEKAGKPLKLSG